MSVDYGYIYKTTNLINGRLYIGQRKGTFTPEYLGSGKIIKMAIKQYGKNSFRLEVIAFATTKQMLDGLEMKYIYEYRQVFGNNFLYNITDGGGGFNGKQTNESKKKMSDSKKGKSPPNKGKKLGFIPKGAFKKGFTPWNKGVSGYSTTSKGPFFGKVHPMLGKHFSEETRENMSKAHLGKPLNHKIDCICCSCKSHRNKMVKNVC